MGEYIYYNGAISGADEKVAGARNRGLKYGDGVFETMLVKEGQVRLGQYHYQRMLDGLRTLKFPEPSFLTSLPDIIIDLCEKNRMAALARVRLTVFRGNGTLTSSDDPIPHLVIESEPVAEDYLSFNKKGLTIDIYKEVKKSCDILSNIKSNNYLPYLMTANHAKDNQLDDCLVLNSYDRICDSSIANLFWVKNNQVFTPPLSEGCVAGVMRRYLIEKIQSAGYAIEEMICPKQKLLEADEIFLTNALFGIRWVQQLREKTYTNKLSSQLYKQFIATL